MKTTRLGSFSAEFQEALRELHDALLQTGAQVARLSGEACSGAVGAGFDEHAGELGRLFERLSAERSTVFLFGPANAGKSTLINALSRRSMVEVSPLPGYPAPVFVEYGDKDEVACQRFDGSSLEGLGPSAAQIELRRAQGELAQHVRSAQGREAQEGQDGQEARPASSLRRIRVSVSNQDLERARVRFVECPATSAPLFDNYADMLMGSHAGPGIAVYCVRAEHLFDESAFQGIEELLGLFKRVHVVVNIDGESRDLSEGGEIVPGLASSDPARLIEVFENVCAQPRLLQALEGGHVRLFPIDLLHAAASAIQPGRQPQLPFEQAEMEGVLEGREFADRESAAFATADPVAVMDESLPRSMRELEGRLSGSLDESEELSTLVKSTLRRAREIMGETFQLLESAELVRARTDHDRAVEAREQNLETGAILERMLARDEREWELEPGFGELRTKLTSRARETADTLRGELGPIFLSFLNDWFESEETLQDLVETSLAPRLAEARNEVQRSVALALRSEWNPVFESFGDATRSELERAGVDPSNHGEVVHEGLSHLEAGQPLRPLDMDGVVVRAGFFDRLMLRSGARLRRKVFGPPDAPDKPLSSKRKAKRFDESARQALRNNVLERLDAYLNDLCRRLATEAVVLQVQRFAESLRHDARSKRQALEAPRTELEHKIEVLETLQEHAQKLALVRSASVERLEPLAARHARADLDVLVPHSPPLVFHEESPDTVAEPVTEQAEKD